MTINIFEMVNKNISDQHCFNYFLELNSKILKITMFDIYRFPNGLLYFDKEYLIPIELKYTMEKIKYLETQPKNTVIAFVHANWIIGIDNKINAMKKKRYLVYKYLINFIYKNI